MPEPKKRTTKRRTGNRRSHLRLKLARRVNKTSPVKVHTTNKQSTKQDTSNVRPKKKAEAKPKTKKSITTKKKSASSSSKKSTKSTTKSNKK